MKKRTIYTVSGVILSLLIAFGGWAVIDGLLARKENALLSTREIIPVNMPVDNSSENSSFNNYPPEITDPATIISEYPKLTASEIYRVLDRWESPGSPQPHEPTEGQLNMEQAIDAAKEWLAYFCQNRWLPAEAIDYDKTNAYLSINIVELELVEENPLINEDEIRDDALLEPFYSYWTVSFSGAGMQTTLIINAGTGQIWQAEIVSNTTNISFNDISKGELLAAFADYIDTGGMDGLVQINAEIITGTSDGQTVSAKAELSLSAIRP